MLFIGLEDKTGKVLGVANVDAAQLKYAKVLEECYPTITYRMHALMCEGKTILAIVVPASTRKPHFSGGAYVREGARSVLASFSEALNRVTIERDVERGRPRIVVTAPGR